MTMTLEQRKQRLAEIDVRQKEILDEATVKHGGSLSAEQRAEYDRLDAEYKRVNVIPRRSPADSSSPYKPATGGGTGWARTGDGQAVPVYGPNDSMAAVNLNSSGEPERLSLGRFLQAKVTGNWRLAEAEHAAMFAGLGTADGTGASFMVPDVLSGQFLDLARSASVVFGWGAVTVPVESDTMRIAGLESDASFAGVGENQIIPESNPTFRSIRLTPKKVATIVRCSRELLEDAPNAGEIIEQSLRVALGKDLDRLFLIGDGGEKGIIGLANLPSIDDTGTTSVGGIEWGDLHTAVVAVKGRNYTPNGYVCSPTIGGDLDILRSEADGSWLGAPPSVRPLTRLETTSIGDTLALVGDGSKIIVGVRRGIQVDFSGEAHESFERDQVLMRITTRVDMNVTHTGAFHVLRGIT